MTTRRGSGVPPERVSLPPGLATMVKTLLAVVDDVIERRLDGIGGDVEFGGLSHGKLP